MCSNDFKDNLEEGVFALTTSGELTYRLLEESLRICAEREWPVLVLTAYIQDQEVAEIRQRCSTGDVCVVPVPAPRAAPQYYFEIDMHWNTRGHLAVARLCTDHLGQRLRLTSR